ncbi:hypothetical protein [Aureimonas mangrovi]|uniref:hypothetical protein n=1 Tax=Aureimonas mangrovi TaxID=2758041 RepID=UPI00163DAE7E|nr:hypothetical protein [Aureimonas mangrovi]
MTDIETRDGRHAPRTHGPAARTSDGAPVLDETRTPTFDGHPAVDRPDGHLKFSTAPATSITNNAFDEAERKDFDNVLEGWYGRAPRTRPRMTRERTLKPATASDPKTDTV